MSKHFKNRLFIVRHGKAKNNELGIESCKMETQLAFGLTEEGRDVVQKEAQNYKDFDVIYSSPFRRTQETAAIFAESSHCPVFLDDRLVDVDIGDFDLHSYESSAAYIKAHPGNDFVHPNGESYLQTFARLVECIQEIDSRYEGKKILIVSHGFPCETLLDWVNEIPLRDWETSIEKGRVFPLN